MLEALSAAIILNSTQHRLLRFGAALVQDGMVGNPAPVRSLHPSWANTKARTPPAFCPCGCPISTTFAEPLVGRRGLQERPVVVIRDVHRAYSHHLDVAP